MKIVLTQFAEAATSHAEEIVAEPGLFQSIGVDWKLLLLQTVAFLLLLWILKKIAYPPLVKMLDEHERAIREAREAANRTKREADHAEAKVEKLLSKARKDAREIVASAKDEAMAMIETSDKKARERAENLVAAAEDDIKKEVIAARKMLRDETLDLVVDATEKVARVKLDTKKDSAVIEAAVKEAVK